MRKTPLIINNIYHIYNRGVDKRDVFFDKHDMERFFLSITEFNSLEPIGSIYQNSFLKKDQLRRPTSKLVEIIAYCLNPNHYHLILQQLVKNGISEFMKRLGGGYTKYINEKHKRSGVLFQGKFKSIHVNSDNYLTHLSAYINLNFRVHNLDQLRRPTSKLCKSSWEEYVTEQKDGKYDGNICWKDFVLSKFKNKNNYKTFALKTVKEIIERKNSAKELEMETLEFEKPKRSRT